MTPSLRNGGLSRRGFLRALGLTACAALVPGLAYPIYRSGTQLVVSQTGFYRMHWRTKNAIGKFTMDTEDLDFMDQAIAFAKSHNATYGWEYLREMPQNWSSRRRRV